MNISLLAYLKLFPQEFSADEETTATHSDPCKVASENSWTAHGSDKVFKEASNKNPLRESS
jgi:hypothetical protein